MGKYVNNGKVTLGTSVDVDDAVREIAQLIGVGRRADGRHHLSDVCIGRGVNMWAKYKPIQSSKSANITDEDRKAALDGITITGADNLTIKTLANIHNVQFTYNKPTGYKRLRDFDGYAHNAQPKPKGSIDSDGYYNDEGMSLGGLMAGVEYPTDNTGVDFTDRLVGTDKSTVLSRSFPCVLFTKSDGTSYFTALTYSDGTYRPLLKNGVYATEAYYCVISKKMKNISNDELSSPFGKETVKATVFMMQSANTLMPMLVASGTNFGTHWIQVTNNLASTYTPIVVPGAIGQSITLNQYFTGVIFAPQSIIGSNNAVGKALTFVVTRTEVTGGTSTNTIQLTTRVTLSDGKSKTVTGTLNGWSGGGLAQTPTIITFDDVLVPNANARYSGTVSITTVDGGNTNVRSLTFTNII